MSAMWPENALIHEVQVSGGEHAPLPNRRVRTKQTRSEERRVNSNGAAQR